MTQIDVTRPTEPTAVLDTTPTFPRPTTTRTPVPPRLMIPSTIPIDTLLNQTPPPTPTRIDRSDLPYPPVRVTPSGIRSLVTPPHGYLGFDLTTTPTWLDFRTQTKIFERLAIATEAIVDGTITHVTIEETHNKRVVSFTLEPSRIWLGSNTPIIVEFNTSDDIDITHLVVEGAQVLVLLEWNPHHDLVRLAGHWWLHEQGFYVSSQYNRPRHRIEPEQLYVLIESYLAQVYK